MNPLTREYLESIGYLAEPEHDYQQDDSDGSGLMGIVVGAIGAGPFWLAFGWLIGWLA